MADRKNITDEEIGAKVVREMSKVNDMNKQAWNDAKGHRDWIESEITDAMNYLKWAQSRIVDIDRRQVELEEMRCASNNFFVKFLKLHSYAMNIIRNFKDQLKAGASVQSVLTQINEQNVADKLKMYSNIFNQKSLEEFSELASKQASGGAELHAQRDDEEFNGTKAAGADARQAGDNIDQQVYNLLLDLEDQITSSLRALEDNEIAAAYNLADWISDADAEKENLTEEIAKKNTYIDKLTLAHNAALAQQAKANSIVTESRAAVDQAIADLQEKRDFWQQEFNRRNEENAVIDEIIHIFKQQVKDMAGGTSYGKK